MLMKNSIGPEPGLGKANKGAPEASRDSGRDENDEKRQRAGQFVSQEERNRGGYDCADVELSLCTDVEEIGLIGECEGKAGQDKRRRLDEDVSESVSVADHRRCKKRECSDWVLSKKEQQRGACGQAKRDGD